MAPSLRPGLLGLLVLATGLAACDCEAVYYDDQAIVRSPLEQCTPYGDCTDLCARVFSLPRDSIDDCRVLGFADADSATVQVTYHENVCSLDWEGSGDDWSDDGWDDPCSDGSCDPPPDDPCGDGSCDPPPDDPPPDDGGYDPPPGPDPPMDEQPTI